MGNNSNSKNTILQCALELFSERGYDAVSVSEIVQKAGVTKPTLYYFFESKEGVFKAILEEKYELLNRKLKSIAIYSGNANSYYDDVYPVLLRIPNLYFDYYKENKTFYLMIMSFMFVPPTSQTCVMVKPYSRKHYEIITSVFSDIAKVHTMFKGKEHQYAITFIAVINSTIAYSNQIGQDLLDNREAESLVRQFMHGVFV